MTRSAPAACLLLLLPLWYGGCATAPRDPAARAEFEANHDPVEPLNRRIFGFNLFLDRILIKPVAQGYRDAVPKAVRQDLRHLLDNLHEPVVFINTLLQGRFKDAGTTGSRFIINSTIGIAGLEDVAAGHHLPRQIGDFGQTLWAWGFPGGPYLIVPVFGPTNPRDGIGLGVDTFALDPWRYVAAADNNAITISRAVLDGIDQRADSIDTLDELQKEAVDYYASFRSYFRQHREAELRNNGPTGSLPPPGLYDDPGK